MVKSLGPGIVLDFDDTLVETTVFFEMARKEFSRLMVELGFPLRETLDKLDFFDIENVKRRGGFLKDCFPLAMVQTYQYFCGLAGAGPEPEICKRVEEMGWWVFKQTPRPVPGARDVLEKLSAGGEHELILATKGDPGIQWERIAASGLKGYFKKIYVLKDKTKREYEMIARMHNFEPGSSWVIGNSIKSDINPGIKAGYKCIYIPNQHTWSYEMEDPRGEFITLDSLAGVPEMVLGAKPLREAIL